jgi:hypothetical protein
MKVTEEQSLGHTPWVNLGLTFILSTLLLGISITIVSDLGQIPPGSLIILVVIMQVVQLAAQIFFNQIVRYLNIVGVLLIGLFGFAAVMWLSLQLIPGFSNISFAESLWISWLYATLIAIMQWVMLAQSDSFLISDARRKTQHQQKNQNSKYGFIFVQLDGVSHPLLEWELNAGNLPNIKALLDSQEYKLTSWQTQIPSTTPASQAGILFGSNDNIPAFRWYDREFGSMIVANKADGAAFIEKRLSNGDGLLADGGVSVGNLFSGDAPTNIMVMSKIGNNKGSVKNMTDYSDYFSSVHGFMRSLIQSLGEITKELYQARRQRKHNIVPRVHRKGSYILLRAGTNVFLRNLQTSIVLHKMMLGVNSLYVDYLDYDEIAHHAGVSRPESLAALAGLDRVAGILLQARKFAPRPYHLIFLSDHGQSQGPTFKQLRGGKNLNSLISEMLNSAIVTSEEVSAEANSGARTLLSGAPGDKSYVSKRARKASRKLDNDLSLKIGKKEQVVVTGSGNLGNIWLRQYKKLATQEQIDKDYPQLTDNLLATKGIGLVLINSKEFGPICKSKAGFIELTTGKVHGKNPLAAYPEIELKQLVKLRSMKSAPDIQLISSMDPSTGEVYAFEELVGNHGGIGGFQTRAMLLYPSVLSIKKSYLTGGKIIDSTTIYKIFKKWLKS